MPANAVKTRKGETNWTAAKRAAKDAKVKEGGYRYWKVVTAIWKKMGGNG